MLAERSPLAVAHDANFFLGTALGTTAQGAKKTRASATEVRKTPLKEMKIRTIELAGK